MTPLHSQRELRTRWCGGVADVLDIADTGVLLHLAMRRVTMTRYSATSKLFEHEEVLREEHHPDELPEREAEIEDLHMALAPAARGVGANNVFLHGKAGQGKTAAVKAELAELEHHAEHESDHLNLTTSYISCESHDHRV